MTTDTVTAKEIAEAKKVSVRAIHKRAKQQGWKAEVVNGRGDKRFIVRHLPADIQKALMAGRSINDDILPILSPEVALALAQEAGSNNGPWGENMRINQNMLRDPKTGKRIRIVQEVMQRPSGIKRRQWIEIVAKKYGVTVQTVYSYIKRYEKKGLAGLAHTRKDKSRARTWDPEALDYWIGLVLKKEHRKIGKHVLYAILRDEASRRHWKIGGYRSALVWAQKKATPQLLALQRGGLRALDNTLPPVLRDYSDLNPFEILVGDQHRFDFWVVDEETGEVFRPEGYFWQDLRTRAFYGGAIDRKYDSYLMGIALRMGLKIFGPFDQIYTDHGKPEESRYIMGIMKEMRNLGLQAAKTVDVPADLGGIDPEEVNPLAAIPGTHRKAIVRNAKAKMIEGTFHIFEAILRDIFRVPGYVKKLGGPQEENEVDQKEIERLARAGKLLTFSEFVLTVFKAMDYYNAKKPHRGVRREWAWKPKPKTATPMDCLKACCVSGWRPVFLNEQAVDLLFLARSNRTRMVDRGRVTFRNEIYEHEKLEKIERKKVEIRFDPMDQEWVLVFHEGEFVCQATPVEFSSMKDKNLATRKIEEKRRRRSKHVQDYRRLTSIVPDIREYSNTAPIEKAAALITREQKTRQKQLEERYGVKTDEEIAEGVARIEAYQAQERRPIFKSEVSRFRWCLEEMAEGKGLLPEDEDFVMRYEAGMSEENRQYWKEFKEAM